MKKVYIIIMSVIFAIGLTGCGKENKTEITEERTEEYTESVSTEELNQSSERVFSEDCMGVFTISINPEVELELDKDGNVLSVVFLNGDVTGLFQFADFGRHGTTFYS